MENFPVPPFVWRRRNRELLMKRPLELREDTKMKLMNVLLSEYDLASSLVEPSPLRTQESLAFAESFQRWITVCTWRLFPFNKTM